MLTHKYMGRICCGVLAICFAITAVFMNWEYFGLTESVSTNTYTQKLFGELAIHEIDIIVDTDDWNDMLDNASDKEYITCTLIIDGETFSNIAIRTKGNSSLQQVQSSGSDRYSFKIEFDHYDNTTSYYGLDKLCLNNIVQDNTYMKDYLAYDLMNQFGVASPLSNYASVSVNGEVFGLYLAVEAVEDAFLQRNYGDDYGELYKPETSDNAIGGDSQQSGQQSGMMAGRMSDSGDTPVFADGMLQTGDSQGDLIDVAQMGGQNQMSGQMSEQNQMQSQMPAQSGMTEVPEMQSGMTEMPEMQSGMTEMPEMTDRSEMQSGMSGGMSMGSSSSGLSSALNYDGDDPDSYSYIFDNAVTNIDESDQTRLISSLQQLSEQEDLEEVVDVEQVIRYFIVHNFLLNFDSYTGSIMHNYYLYEEDGVMSMIPWDYNLSFVAFQTSYSTQEMINYPIDTPVSGNTVEDRAMLAWIFADEEYTELYHELYQEFIDDLFLSGYFEEKVTAVAELIDGDVESDPSKFCTYEQFTQGVETLIDFVALRVESIVGQLNGTIGSTDEAQAANPTALISAGDVDVTDTGTENVQTGTGNIQSPTRSQGGQMSGMSGQSGMSGMMGGMMDMMGGMTGMTGTSGSQTTLSESFEDYEFTNRFTQITQSLGISDEQVLIAGSAVVLAAGFAIVFFYRRRTQ